MLKSSLVWGATIIFSAFFMTPPAQSGQVSYEYDSLGRLTQVLSVSPEAIQEMTFQYDAAGNRVGRAVAELTDSDGDLIPDYYEDLYVFLDASNPLDALKDYENDELSNYEEFLYGTDPSDPDTDGDGDEDGAEVLQGTDPLNPGSYRGYFNKVPATGTFSTLLIFSALTALGVLTTKRGRS